MSQEIEFALLRELYAKYPPILQIKQVAEILREDVPTVRARIRRGAFPVAVRQEERGRQYVLLTDLVRFICTGESQSQQVSKSKNNGKRGRPTKAEQIKSQGAA